MKTIWIWINAARPRTLLLSISGIIMGAGCAFYYGIENNHLFILALVTAICFQVTSNFANDYGDGIKGTDDKNRVGPKRMLQSGLLTEVQLKNGIIFSSSLGLLSAMILLYLSFDATQLGYALFFLCLALTAIWASIKYTVGINAYGYMALGDLFVFLFFGLVAVLGSFFLLTHRLEEILIWPALGIGFWSVGVLNLNNLRDIEGDLKHGKKTIAGMLGFKWGKIYHFVLISAGFFSFLIMILFVRNFLFISIFTLVIAVLAHHLYIVFITNEPIKLDNELKKIALCTFTISFAFYISTKFLN